MGSVDKSSKFQNMTLPSSLKIRTIKHSNKYFIFTFIYIYGNFKEPFQITHKRSLQWKYQGYKLFLLWQTLNKKEPPLSNS